MLLSELPARVTTRTQFQWKRRSKGAWGSGEDYEKTGQVRTRKAEGL